MGDMITERVWNGYKWETLTTAETERFNYRRVYLIGGKSDNTTIRTRWVKGSKIRENETIKTYWEDTSHNAFTESCNGFYDDKYIYTCISVGKNTNVGKSIKVWNYGNSPWILNENELQPKNGTKMFGWTDVENSFDIEANSVISVDATLSQNHVKSEGHAPGVVAVPDVSDLRICIAVGQNDDHGGSTIDSAHVTSSDSVAPSMGNETSMTPGAQFNNDNNESGSTIKFMFLSNLTIYNPFRFKDMGNSFKFKGSHIECLSFKKGTRKLFVSVGSNKSEHETSSVTPFSPGDNVTIKSYIWGEHDQDSVLIKTTWKDAEGSLFTGGGNHVIYDVWSNYFLASGYNIPGGSDTDTTLKRAKVTYESTGFTGIGNWEDCGDNYFIKEGNCIAIGNVLGDGTWRDGTSGEYYVDDGKMGTLINTSARNIIGSIIYVAVGRDVSDFTENENNVTIKYAFRSVNAGDKLSWKNVDIDQCFTDRGITVKYDIQEKRFYATGKNRIIGGTGYKSSTKYSNNGIIWKDLHEPLFEDSTNDIERLGKEKTTYTPEEIRRSLLSDDPTFLDVVNYGCTIV